MSTNAWWWLTLGLGLVVAIVVVVLLQVFYAKLQRVERGADAIWLAGKQVARNTATTWMLGQTRGELDQLTAEAMRHGALLDAVKAGAEPGGGQT